MELTAGVRAQIDALSYERLLQRWRFAPIGDPMFQGDSGDYWKKRMAELRTAGEDHAGASKRLGW